MSYILDALKKAERDRLREDPKELDDFASSSWDPYQQKTESNSVKYLALVVGFLTLLLGLVIYSGSLSPAPSGELLVTKPVIEEILIQEAAPEPLKAELRAKKAATLPVEASLRIPLPKLTISGQMYLSEGSPSNRLFAGQRSFKVGDKLDQHWTLVGINLQDYVVQSGDQSATMPYR